MRLRHGPPPTPPSAGAAHPAGNRPCKQRSQLSSPPPPASGIRLSVDWAGSGCLRRPAVGPAEGEGQTRDRGGSSAAQEPEGGCPAADPNVALFMLTFSVLMEY